MINIFLGPTLSSEDACAILPEATICPPAAQGDVWRAALKRPRAIGIIDGYFERLPAVWHKEILWAMSQGIHVYGAASIGALRAAELEPFGMRGVGEVYEAYSTGVLERDDEVAVMHGDASCSYRLLSVALVDVRATLRAASRTGVLAEQDVAALLDAAAGRHYSERRWPIIVEDAARRSNRSVLDSFVRWLPQGERSQKAEDARAMLALMKRRLDDDATPMSVAFEFEQTYFWSEACRHGACAEDVVSEGNLSEALLDELRLMGAERYEAALAAASARYLASEWARERGIVASDEQAQAVWIDVVARHALDNATLRKAWCDQQRLEPIELLHWMRREAIHGHARRSCEAGILRYLPDALRASGEYAALLERASLKLSEEPQETPPDAEAVLRWYYEDRLGQSVPHALDAELSRLGLADRDVWLRVLARELAFSRRKVPRVEGG
jgi:hypothetical protein